MALEGSTPTLPKLMTSTYPHSGIKVAEIFPIYNDEFVHIVKLHIEVTFVSEALLNNFYNALFVAKPIEDCPDLPPEPAIPYCKPKIVSKTVLELYPEPPKFESIYTNLNLLLSDLTAATGYKFNDIDTSPFAHLNKSQEQIEMESATEQPPSYLPAYSDPCGLPSSAVQQAFAALSLTPENETMTEQAAAGHRPT